MNATKTKNAPAAKPAVKATVAKKPEVKAPAVITPEVPAPSDVKARLAALQEKKDAIDAQAKRESEDIEKERKELLKGLKADDLKTVRELVALHSFTAAEIGLDKPIKVKGAKVVLAAPTYIGPEDVKARGKVLLTTLTEDKEGKGKKGDKVLDKEGKGIVPNWIQTKFNAIRAEAPKDTIEESFAKLEAWLAPFAAKATEAAK